jgi:hypothetical protein
VLGSSWLDGVSWELKRKEAANPKSFIFFLGRHLEVKYAKERDNGYD